MGLAFKDQPGGGYWTAQNWMVPQVREYKSALLQEIIERYKPDGISLDFLRAPLFFNASTSTSAERHSIMGAWVRDLKARMVAGGVPTLSARVPPDTRTLDAIGLDLGALSKDGTLAFLTLGINYDSFMLQDSDALAIVRTLPPAFPTLFEVSYVRSPWAKQNAEWSGLPSGLLGPPPTLEIPLAS